MEFVPLAEVSGLSKVVSLGDFFSSADLLELLKILKSGNLGRLRLFLNRHKADLALKGVLADHLYYYLMYRIEMGGSYGR
jgi:hypothetical protein